jgi:hypothetical protein
MSKIDCFAPPRNSFSTANVNCPKSSGQFFADAPAPILALCKELLEAGVDPDGAAEIYWRGVQRHG